MDLAIEEFASRDEAMAAAGARIANALKQALDARGGACVALSGGSTPEPAYRAAASADLAWSNVDLALVDERFVPPSDPASNEGMVRRAFAPALEAGARLAPLWSPAEHVEEAAGLADSAYTRLHFDIAVLGLGGDAHTASWFPHNAALDTLLAPDNPRAVMGLHEPNAAGASARLTMTYAALARVPSLLLLITGQDKRARLEQALNEAPADAPIAAVLNGLSDKLSIVWAP